MSQGVNDTRIVCVAGSGIVLRGDDIDTDQILPARHLKAITFQGMEAHLFEDARSAARTEGRSHPLDAPRFAGGSVLLVNRNFGCGSSREHAPQSLHRFGIQAIIGESFGEIFAGNGVAIGMPCVQADAETIADLQALVEAEPLTELTLDLAASTVTAAGRVFPVTLAAGRRRQFVEGTWDATSVLLAAGPLIERKLADLVALPGTGDDAPLRRGQS
jgi:3-isopropylmalate/(R)-2-methylmalate dehydratase small subunit